MMLAFREGWKEITIILKKQHQPAMNTQDSSQPNS